MSNVEALEKQYEGNREFIARRDAVHRLRQNPDFRKIVEEYYLRDEALRFLNLSCSPSLSDKDRGEALVMAQATAYFQQFLSVTIRMGNSAEDSLPQLEEALAEARQEESAAEIVPATDGGLA